ncbi:hypothetical protein O7599_00075 [Streptomyces sp. WMMC500]|uniref:hypothetical protein n=1 Tax=Streptomyces sp. WMMC500 TaxID=3015154 RepID=UPI00248B9570|nr:hypothetical protein [Streptomyces sp. WMMC500]WBB60999.1 hypothetical protein O7599_00075 [Streptomyces sp. WMMC500]
MAHDLDLDGWVRLYTTSSVAQLDNLIAAWHFKHECDAVRPFCAIRHVYGRQKVRAWGGPGKGATEPWLVPAADTELDHATWTDFVRDAAMSRVWAGVNFTKTAERSVEFGMQFGGMAYEFVQRHVEGDVED